MRVPSGAATPTAHADLIERAVSLLPMAARDAQLDGAVHLRHVKGYRAELEISLKDPDVMPSILVASGLKRVYLGASRPYSDNSLMVPLEANDPEELRGKPVDVLFLYEDGRPGIEGSFLIQ